MDGVKMIGDSKRLSFTVIFVKYQKNHEVKFKINLVLNC